MNKIKNMIWFVMLGLYFSCSSTGSTPQKTGSYTVEFEEDLSVYRTSYDYKVAEEPFSTENEKPVSGTKPEQAIKFSGDISITEDLNQLLEDIANKNKEVKEIQGYTILVYSGNNRERADQIKRRVYHIIPDARPLVKFTPPNYKVQVGQFVERLEAQKTYSVLKKEFSNAIIIPDPIRINN